jgi:hypothetical protein
MTTKRYYELAAKLDDEIYEVGIKLDLNCPCDRAILSECGLTPEEAFELLSLWDEAHDESEEETRRFPIEDL